MPLHAFLWGPSIWKFELHSLCLLTVSWNVVVSSIIAELLLWFFFSMRFYNFRFSSNWNSFNCIKLAHLGFFCLKNWCSFWLITSLFMRFWKLISVDLKYSIMARCFPCELGSAYTISWLLLGFQWVRLGLLLESWNYKTFGVNLAVPNDHVSSRGTLMVLDEMTSIN